VQAKAPSRPWSAFLVTVGAIAVVATGVVFWRAFGHDPTAFMWAAPSVGGYVGGVVAVRMEPHGVTSRRLLAFGTLSSTWIATTVALADAFDDRREGWWLAPGNIAVQVLGLAMWAAMIALLAVYPDGTYRRRHQRVASQTLPVLAVAVPLALLVVQATVHPAWVFAWGDAESGAVAFPVIESPLHVPVLGGLAPFLRSYVDAALAGSTLVAGLVVALRYRTLPPGERLALRWAIYGVTAVLVAPLAVTLEAVGALSTSTAQVLQVSALLALPTALTVGLVRPRAFDIDRAVRRSIVYAVLWTAIAVAYVGGAAVLGLAAPGEGVQLAIAATIGATLFFDPARRWLARRASAWAYGESISGEELVRRLGGALENSADIPRLAGAVASIAREGLGAEWVRVSVPGTDAVVAGDPTDEPVTTAPLVRDDEVLGVIECGPPVRRPGRGEPRLNQELLRTLASQAALAVHNARLASELGQRLRDIETASAELAASRSRIVAAHESARRQIERDIHDGAQQDIVALMAGMGVARQQLARNPESVEKILDELQANAAEALESLRQIAAGIHPPVLSDHGLAEAIEMRSARLPISVVVDCPPAVRGRRFGDAVEGVAYYFVSEALANTLKHAAATAAHVVLAEEGAWLHVSVCDDGQGFDPEGARGSGLLGIRDRVEAIGGTVAVASTPGHGSRLTMRAPISERSPA